MLKCFLYATAIIVSICGFVQNNLKAGSVACGVKLNSDPSVNTYCESTGYMIVHVGGVSGLTNGIYINGDGAAFKGNIEFLGTYSSNNYNKITLWDWAKHADNGNYYIALCNVSTDQYNYQNNGTGGLGKFLKRNFEFPEYQGHYYDVIRYRNITLKTSGGNPEYWRNTLDLWDWTWNGGQGRWELLYSYDYTRTPGGNAPFQSPDEYMHWLEPWGATSPNSFPQTGFMQRHIYLDYVEHPLTSSTTSWVNGHSWTKGFPSNTPTNSFVVNRP